MRGARPPFGDVARPLRTGDPFGKSRFVGTHPRLQAALSAPGRLPVCAVPHSPRHLPDRRVGAIRVRSVRRSPSAEPRHVCRCHFAGRARSTATGTRGYSAGKRPTGRFPWVFRAIVVDPTTTNCRRALVRRPQQPPGPTRRCRAPRRLPDAAPGAGVHGQPPCPFGTRPPKPRRLRAPLSCMSPSLAPIRSIAGDTGKHLLAPGLRVSHCTRSIGPSVLNRRGNCMPGCPAQRCTSALKSF